MHQLVESVLNGNLDVQAAVERVKQAQAHHHAAARGAAARTGRHRDGASDTRQNTPPPLGYVRQAGFGVAAELDAGRVRRRTACGAGRAGAGRRAVKQALNQLRLALAANTAAAYIDLRWAQSELQILQRQRADPRAARCKLTQERLHYGLSTQLDVARAQNQLQDLQAQIPRVQSTIQHQLSLIAVYSGRTPESVDRLLLAQCRATFRYPAQSVPQMLPSEALLRRPGRAHRLCRCRTARGGSGGVEGAALSAVQAESRGWLAGVVVSRLADA